MTPAAKCRRLATMLRAKAELERDPEIRVEWKCIARGYLIINLSGMAVRTLATRPSHECAISTKKWPERV
jgi:hypothetical protein